MYNDGSRTYGVYFGLTRMDLAVLSLRRYILSEQLLSTGIGTPGNGMQESLGSNTLHHNVNIPENEEFID